VASGKAYALALGVALVASVSSLRNGFVYDDVPVIQRDERIHAVGDLPALVRAPFWASGYRPNAYRPVTTVAFALDWNLGGGRPLAFHATNVALHLMVVALVLALASRVLGSGGALVASLWFAVQPVHVEAVAGAVGLAELLAAAAYLAAVLAYVADGEAADAGRNAAARRGWLAVAVLACAAVAYGAKEHAITLPAVLLLADAWQAHTAGQRFRARFRRHVVLWLGVVTVAIGYLAARAAVLGPLFSGGAVATGIEGRSVLGRVLIMLPALLIWLRWLLLPIHLSADYLPNAFVPSARLGLPQVAGLAALAALALAAWKARQRAPGVTAGIVFGAVTASVAANVVVPTGVLLAERLAYLPSVGAALVAGALWELLPARGLTWTVTAALLGLLALRTVSRIQVWRDQDRFLTALTHDAPDSYRTHWALGADAFERGAFGTGEREMLAAIRINPGDATLVQELGEKYLAAGLYAPAARFLAAGYRLNTLRTGAAARGVFAFLKAGQPDSAAALGLAALRRAPDDEGLLVVTAEAQLAGGRPRQALALARRLVFAAPRNWGYEQVAGYAAARNGRCDEARARLERARALAPSEPGPGAALRRLDGGADCGIGR
jgi:tetratricopeptide (TPR) repeat protein